MSLQKFLTTHKAPKEALAQVAHALNSHDEPVRPADLANELDASAVQRTRAINLLEQAGVTGTTSNGDLVYARPDVPPHEAVDRAEEISETHQRMIASRLRMVSGYAETTGCRRQYLLGYFGEQREHPCGNCDTCDAGTAERRPAATDEFRANSAVRHQEWGHGVVMSVEQDRLTVLFDDQGYKVLSLAAVTNQQLLTVLDPT